MNETPDRRQAVRLTVPWHLGGPGVESRLVRLLELSSRGARIEHPERLNEGLVCYVDLPPALGRVLLTGKVVWTKLHKGEQTFEGEKHSYYQSGIFFVGITSEQKTALASALEILRAEHDRPQ
ncbi:MAG TPA: PilZ domain-containing protein, partial [Candidatus Acidoferrum sp.]|nr:PilZ domain-containing protein [Candidatus Acidoferrum sp.]